MLSDSEFSEYGVARGLSAAAFDYIRQVRESDPSRKVGEYARKSVSVAYPSQKMGRTIQAESRGVELALVVTFEFDCDVIEYWDQPAPVTINRTIKGGAKRNHSYTPDYAVLKRSGVIIVEGKTEEELCRLSERYPDDWVRDESGNWAFIPAQKAYARIGLEHVVISSAVLNPIAVENKKLLLRVRPEYWGEEEVKKLQKTLASVAAISIDELAERASLLSITPILAAIRQGVIYSDIDGQLLANTDVATVSLDDEVYKLAQEYKNDSGSSYISGEVETERVPSAKDLKKAYDKLQLVKQNVPSRSVRRYRALIAEGGKKGLSPLQSLIPKTRNSGNRKQRVPSAVEGFLLEFIESNYSSSVRLSKSRSYNKYCAEARKTHPEYPPVSHVTFSNRINAYNQEAIQLGRGGRRAANAASEPTDVLKRGLRPTRGFQLTSLDHYRGDIALVVLESDGKTYTAFPWITAMVDVFSGAVISFWISFNAPSSLSCAMVMRDCARRHGRLPEAIVVDHGADFKSVYFQSLLAHFGIERVQRPPGNPRYGSEVERLFGEFKTLWISALPGNVADYKESRSVSSSHSPHKVASMNVEEFYEGMERFVEWKNGVVKSDTNIPPAIKLQSSLDKFGEVSGVSVTVDREFYITSAVDVRNYKIDRRRGIHIDERWYWAPELSSYVGRKSDVEVRKEPENPYLVYALIDGVWVNCLSRDFQVFALKKETVKRAESLRILQGRKLRDLAKNEANEKLMQELASRMPKDIEKPPQPEQGVVSDKGESVFAQFVDKEIGDIDVGTW